MCPTVADAEDAVQETLLDAYRGVAGFDGRASLRSWMSRILFRRAGKAMRKRIRGPIVNEELVSPAAAKSTSGQASDSRMDLEAALAKLGKDHRDIIVLRELQGMSYAEIAETLGIPQGTVESRIYRARAELRALLSAYDPAAT